MKVLFDTDPGIDDAMALLYLHACPNLDLLGITTILGNASIDQCTTNALILCEKFGIDVPVYRGAETAISGKMEDFYPDFVHGKNGLGDIELPTPVRKIESESALEAIVRFADQHAGELTIIAVGRLTNLALAIQADNSIRDKVKDIVIMGGAVKEEGNVTPFAEANIIGDPEAAQVVFESGIPLTLVGLDVTLQTRLSNEYLQSIAEGVGDLGEFILGINRKYQQYNKERYGWDAFPVHDSSAIAYADQPNLFQTETGTIHCVLEGEERGRTVFTPVTDGIHRVCTAVDSEGMLNRYHEITTSKK